MEVIFFQQLGEVTLEGACQIESETNLTAHPLFGSFDISADCLRSVRHFISGYIALVRADKAGAILRHNASSGE